MSCVLGQTHSYFISSMCLCRGQAVNINWVRKTKGLVNPGQKGSSVSGLSYGPQLRHQSGHPRQNLSSHRNWLTSSSS